MIPLYIRSTRMNKDLIVYGKRKFMDFTYIDDAVHGITKAIEHLESAGNDIFNIASGEAVSLLRVARLIRST